MIWSCCVGGVALLLVTIVLYFMSSVLGKYNTCSYILYWHMENLPCSAGVVNQNPSGMCSDVAPLKIGNGSIQEVYITYLKVSLLLDLAWFLNHNLTQEPCRRLRPIDIALLEKNVFLF